MKIKKPVYIVFFMALLISLSACAMGVKQQTSAGQDKKDSRTVVVYFSATGTTRNVAGKLAAATGADLYEIQPETPYTDADLDWRDDNSRSSREMHDPGSRPAIKGEIKDLSRYDVVFIGYPIWWYTNPTIINTFIETHELEGKRLVPFATSGGSAIDKSCDDLRKAYPTLNWEKGRLLNDVDGKDLEDWGNSFK